MKGAKHILPILTVSIPLGTINTAAVTLLASIFSVSIPLGTINTPPPFSV